MKKIISVLFGTLLACSVHAAELTELALQGSWLITHFQDQPDSSGDLWQFEGDNFYQNLGGQVSVVRTPPSYRM